MSVRRAAPSLSRLSRPMFVPPVVTPFKHTTTRFPRLPSPHRPSRTPAPASCHLKPDADNPNHQHQPRIHASTPARARRRIRVARHHSHHATDWQWSGARSNNPLSPSSSSDLPPPPPASPDNQDVVATLQQSVEQVLRVLLIRSRQTLEQTTVPLLTRITRVLRVLGRSLWTSSDDAGVDITVEYGIADPCPHDKNYVDPLYDWNLAARPDDASRYNDSFGNAVYLQLDGGTASGSVIASDFRDIAEECVTDDEHATGNTGNGIDMNDAGDDSDCNKTKDGT